MAVKFVVGLFSSKGIAEDSCNRLRTEGVPARDIALLVLRQTAPTREVETVADELEALAVDPLVIRQYVRDVSRLMSETAKQRFSCGRIPRPMSSWRPARSGNTRRCGSRLAGSRRARRGRTNCCSAGRRILDRPLRRRVRACRSGLAAVLLLMSITSVPGLLLQLRMRCDCGNFSGSARCSRRRPDGAQADAALAQHQRADHDDVRGVEDDAGRERDRVEPGPVVDRPGEPAAERHPRTGEQQHGRHPPGRLGGREQLSDRDDISGDDAAEAEAERGRDREQAGLVLGQEKPGHRRDLAHRAGQHRAQPADAVGDPAPRTAG